MQTKKGTKSAKVVTQDPTQTTGEVVNRIDKACDLLLECMDINQISKSEAVSAMSSIICSIMAAYNDPDHFHTLIKMMTQAFKEGRGP